MLDNHSLDEIRRQIQESLAQSKREQLRDEFGMTYEYTDPRLSLEVQNDFLDNILEFERQFEDAQSITVRERIGNPSLQSVEEIPQHALEEALDNLLDLLFDHGIAVDFMGEWDDLAAYRFITDELLDEETDDIRIEGMISHFPAATPEYDLQMWVENFVQDVFWQEREYFLPGLEKQLLFDTAGRPITAAEFSQKLEAVWSRLPVSNHIDVKPIETQVGEDEGSLTAVITWQCDDEQKEIESQFRLQPSLYGGWDVVQTSLLDDLLMITVG
ncbi:MAG: hypothetical protein BMS9Abin02_0361 [Anaerolineae bacterium]|nr:MAG: hypothetical protein BMS9Abin02_0361 [Anaerolineae bacterium]